MPVVSPACKACDAFFRACSSGLGELKGVGGYRRSGGGMGRERDLCKETVYYSPGWDCGKGSLV